MDDAEAAEIERILRPDDAFATRTKQHVLQTVSISALLFQTRERMKTPDFDETPSRLLEAVLERKPEHGDAKWLLDHCDKIRRLGVEAVAASWRETNGDIPCEAMLMIADLLAARGSGVEAREMLESVADGFPSAKARIAVCCSKLTMGRREERSARPCSMRHSRPIRKIR